MSNGCVLVVDDDPVAVRVATLALKPLNLRVMAIERGNAVMTTLERERPSAVILDLILKDMHGLDVCRAIRRQSLVPIMVVTIIGSHQERLDCLRAGADDVLTKPYDPEELSLRLNGLIKRAEGGAPATPRPYCFRGLVVDPLAHTATLHGETLSLTATEARLLEELAGRPGVVHTPKQLLLHLCGPHAEEQLPNLYLQVSRLRRKLGDQRGQPIYLQTRARQGYYLAAPTHDS